ncbi:hypothetical protein DRP53_02240 [candidate division WOR-3 bacterium]|uniref:CheC-like protein domain-containing protein n=1 Tax=candidate division WOR-3 bacterium TaxID=2052148 RepID=A0A660SKG6_UNCW3|nr:MAG: hypothetical protein DRP53_02240 [candidate division WOR-3 bacterium]
MIDLKNITPDQIDALREIASVGSGHAATSLSELLSEKVMVRVPKVLLGTIKDVIEQIASPDEPVWSVFMYFLGDLTGRTLLIYPVVDAEYLLEIMAPGNRDEDYRISVMKEISNILSCAYMNALGEMIGLLILPSVPGMVVDLAGAILSSVVLEFSEEKDFVICLESEFYIATKKRTIKSYYLMMPDISSVEVLLKKVNLL